MARMVRLTSGQLRKIIREEARVLQEADDVSSRLLEDFDVDDLHVHIGEGNTGLVGTFDGTIDGVDVEGRLYYSMESADAGMLEITECDPERMLDRVWEAIDGSPEFSDWSSWAAQQVDED